VFKIWGEVHGQFLLQASLHENGLVYAGRVSLSSQMMVRYETIYTAKLGCLMTG